MKKTFILVAFCTQMFMGVVQVHAQTSPDLTVTPVVIDEKAKARDILKESITVKNNSNHVLELYPSVNDINSQLGEKAFTRANDSQALSDSLANWIELSRGMVQLSPGEERSIPFIIRVNINAVAQSYHAKISLTEGITRAEADSKPALGVVMVNVEVQADVHELLQLNKFTTDNIFFSGDDVLFNYQLQNIGNQNLLPKGQVHIYNRNGQEVATIDVNKDSKSISPDQTSQLVSVWSAANSFGRYKALLTVDYGSSQTATVQDTVFFWVIPWKQMLILFIVSLITVVGLAVYFHNWLERRHLYRFAHAGLLNEDTLKKITTFEPLPLAQPQILRQSEMTQKATTPPPAESVKSEHRSLKEVLQKEEKPTVYGSAINLKEMRASTALAPVPQAHARPEAWVDKAQVHGHIISLKKPS